MDWATDRIQTDLAYRFRHRREFSARATRNRSRQSIIYRAKEDRLDLLALCKALRAMRRVYR